MLVHFDKNIEKHLLFYYKTFLVNYFELHKVSEATAKS